MGKLAGKVALVTGATSGIGFAVAKRFIKEGAYVFITGRKQEDLDRAVKELGTQAMGVRSDVSKLGDIDHLMTVIKKEKGHLDVLSANAGGGRVCAPRSNHRGALRFYFRY